MSVKEKIFSQKTAYLFILLLLLANRVISLCLFGFQYVDSDQTVVWAATMDYLKGQFHEPCFYGQTYNPMVEALFAVPLVALKVPIYIALPIVTSLMTLFPFIALSIVAYSQGKRTTAVLIAAYPLFLPAEYDMITSMPRGFVAGVFFAGLSVFILMKGDKKSNFFWGAFFAALTMYVNPNGLLLLVPYYTYLLLKNYKQLNLYVWSVLGSIVPAIIYFSSNQFYKMHPTYDLHKAWEIFFSWKIFKEQVPGLTEHLGNVTPYIWETSWPLLIVIVACIIILFVRKQKAMGIASIVGLLFLIFSLGISKTADGTDQLFMPYSRMFLALPVFMCLLFLWTINMKFSKVIYLLIAVAAVCSFYNKPDYLREAIDTHADPLLNHIVLVDTVPHLCEICECLQKTVDSTHADLVIFAEGRLNQRNYGCAALTKNFPSTIMPTDERRTWRLLDEENKVRENVLVNDGDEDKWRRLLAEMPNAVQCAQIPGLYWIKGNKLKTKDLLLKVGIKSRPY